VPIANCFVRDDLTTRAPAEGLTAIWAEESGIGDEDMTINVVAGTGQHGAPYAVMAFHYLPSLWSREDVCRLQVGLASALGRSLAVDPAEVQVITSIVESGHVVEDGETRDW
jgi:hypothetical protein